MRGGLLWSGGLALSAFIVGTAIGAYLFSRNPYNRISYLDLVLPTHWSELREKRGLTLIDEGLSELKKERYGPGIMLVNHGLRLAPSNIPARMIMGQLYAQGGMMQRAVKVFREGIPYADGQRRYLDITFRLTEYMEDYEQVLAMTEDAMPTVSGEDSNTRRWLRDKRAAALVKLGRLDEVLALWGKSHDEPSRALNTARARALTGVGRGAEAIGAIVAEPAAFGVFAEPWELLIELALQTGDTGTGRRTADTLVELDANDFVLATDRIVYLTKIGATRDAIDVIDTYFFYFGVQPAAQSHLLKKLEDCANIKVLHAIWDQVRSLGKPGLSTHIAYVQDLVMAGEISEALREFEQARHEIEVGGTNEESWAQGNRLLLDLLVTDSPSARSQLLTFCSGNSLNPDAYRLLVFSLLRNSRPVSAKDMVALARNRYPAIQGLPEIEITDKDLVGSVPVPVLEAKDEVRLTNPEARIELVALEVDMKNRDWVSAVTRIAKIEKSPLAKKLDEELLYDRILIHGQLSNQTELSWYMRRLLELKSFKSSRLRAIAQTLQEAERSDSALTLLREVLRQHPEAGWAATLRQAIQDELKAAPLETGNPIKLEL